MRVARGIRAPLAMATLALLATSGCGGGPGDDGLRGIVPADRPPIGAVSLPEVRADGTVSPLALAPPAGKWRIVYFGYASCPDVCPTTLADLHTALAALGDTASRFEVAFVTVDMARDSAAVLGPYVRSLIPGAHALRPAGQEQLATAERAFGASSTVTRSLAGKVEVTHTAVGYVVDERGAIRVEWSFGTPPEDMTHDMRVLVAAASRGTR